MPNIIKILQENARKAKEKERLANLPPQSPAEANRRLLEDAVIGNSYDIKEDLKYGADINTTDPHNNNALMLAAMDFSVLCSDGNFNCLIKRGIDINHQNNNGETALMILTRYFEPLEKSDKYYFRDAFVKLVKNKADFSIPDKNNKEVYDELCARFFPDNSPIIEYCLKKAYKYAPTPAQRAYINKKQYSFEQLLASSKEKKGKDLTLNPNLINKDNSRA